MSLLILQAVVTLKGLLKKTRGKKDHEEDDRDIVVEKQRTPGTFHHVNWNHPSSEHPVRKPTMSSIPEATELGTTAAEHEKDIYMVYFPRSCHHLFNHMFSQQPNVKMLEVLLHTNRFWTESIELTAVNDLNSAKDQCEELRNVMNKGWQDWMEDAAGKRKSGKRVMSSCSSAMQISPAVHQVYHERKRQGSGKLTNPSQSSRLDLVSLTSMSPSSPKSLEYWLPEPSNSESLLPPNPTPYPESFLRSQISAFQT